MSELESISALLTAYKQDRSKPFDPRFVTSTYIQFDQAVSKIENPENDPKARDLLHVLSLALMTVGLNRTAPSHYAIILTLGRLLSHLELRPMFTHNESVVVRHRLNSARESLDSVENEDIQVSDKVKRMVSVQLDECFASLDIIQALLKATPEQDMYLYSQVIHLRREIFNLLVDDNFKPSDLNYPKSKLLQIQHHLENTNHQISWMLRHHIEACKFITDYFSEGPSYIESLSSEYQRLVEIQKDLSVLLVTRRWTLRETDIYNYQIELGKLDAKVASSFKNSEHFKLPDLDAPVAKLHESFVAAGPFLFPFFLVRKAHSLIYKLLDNAEPITEALQPIFNQLSTAKRCLLDVKSLGLSNLQELYPYQMQLRSMEKKRVDGKFLVGDDVPPGQGILNNLLAECYDLVYELEVDLEERPQSDNEHEHENDDDDDEI